MRLKSVLAAALLALAAIVSLVSTTLADDFAPPPWRGGPNYTIQGWEFLDSGDPVPGGYVKVADDPGVPQVWGNGVVPFFAPIPGVGSSTAVPLATWADTMIWSPGADGDGGWTSDGFEFMTLWIPNWIDNELLKLLRIQLTWQGDVAPFVDGLILGGFGNNPINTVPGAPDPPVNVDSHHVYQDWRIVPNPHWERISIAIPFGTRIDEIVVDTISFSIPEPSSAFLLVLAVAGMMTWRRR